MLADARTLGHGLDGVGTKVFRMRRGETDAADAVDRIDRAQQVGELGTVLSGAEVTPVGVHVLSEERDLDDAVAGEFFDFVSGIFG